MWQNEMVLVGRMRAWSLIAIVVWSIFSLGRSSDDCCFAQDATAADKKQKTETNEQVISIAVEQLLKLQDEDGAWPYEGVYRVRGKIPVGYRIGGTCICCEAILYGASKDDSKAKEAIVRGVELILKELDDPRMKPIKPRRYDVRIWGHIWALDLFCRLKESGRFSELEERLDTRIVALTEALVFQQSPKGGWNYANGAAHASFVTSPAIHALLWARQVGQEVPKSVFENAATELYKSRNKDVAYAYSGPERSRRPSPIQGSIARSANSEMTLSLMGLSSPNAIEHAINKFHEHWDELEKRRKKTGTHVPPFGIAPYYFYYAHRYAAMAIHGLPEESRAEQVEKLKAVIMKTRDNDGTWNDRVFPRSRAYGTAMSVLALLDDQVPLPLPLVRTSFVIGDSKKYPKDISIRVDPEFAKPDLILQFSADKTVKVGDRQMTLEEFEAWVADNPFKVMPSLIELQVDGKVTGGQMQELRKIIDRHLGLPRLLVDVKEDENQR